MYLEKEDRSDIGFVDPVPDIVLSTKLALPKLT